MNKMALQFWSQVIQVAAAVVLVLSAVLMLGIPLLLARRHFGPPR